MKYAGAYWIRRSLKRELSVFGEQVADLLGNAFLGIYHLDEKALQRVDWKNDSCIRVIISYRPLSTVDSDELTRLVVGAHDRALRLRIEAVAPSRLLLIISQRRREGPVYDRCPTIEEHIGAIR